jgi:hypothetical protein
MRRGRSISGPSWRMNSNFSTGVQLHAVFRHANLLMKNVEKAHAFHPHDPGGRQAPEVRLRLCQPRRERLAHLDEFSSLR